MKTIIVGICGGSGSGKTTLARKLVEKLDGNAVLVCMDSFYKTQPGTTYEERCKTNYDHPDTFDKDLIVKCLTDLKEGRDTDVPIFDYTIHERSSQPWTHIKAAPIVIFEGILSFAIPEVVELLDKKIYVDTPADIRILRRVKRDVNDRGRTIQSVMNQYINTVRPMHFKFVEPCKELANIIVNEGGKNEVALELILEALQKEIGI